MTHALGIDAVNPAGSTAANAAVPSRDTIIRSTNCIKVKDVVDTIIGPAKPSIYRSDVSSTAAGLCILVCSNRPVLLSINRLCIHTSVHTFHKPLNSSARIQKLQYNTPPPKMMPDSQVA
jgi:hypothetical protein